MIAFGLTLTTGIAQAQEKLGGRAEVIDGETIAFGATRVRLYGIAAPAMEELCLDGNRAAYDCGSVALGILQRLVAGKSLTCRRRGAPAENIAALCFVGRVDLGREMIRRGWAVAEDHGSRDYESMQHEARAAKRGMWAGSFEPPQRWREEHSSLRRPGTGN